MIRLKRVGGDSVTLFVDALVDTGGIARRPFYVQFQWAAKMERHVLIHKEADKLEPATERAARASEAGISDVFPDVKYYRVRGTVILSHSAEGPSSGERDTEEIECSIYVCAPGQSVLGDQSVDELPSLLGDDVAGDFRRVKGQLAIERK